MQSDIIYEIPIPFPWTNDGLNTAVIQIKSIDLDGLFDFDLRICI